MLFRQRCLLPPMNISAFRPQSAEFHSQPWLRALPVLRTETPVASPDESSCSGAAEPCRSAPCGTREFRHTAANPSLQSLWPAARLLGPIPFELLAPATLRALRTKSVPGGLRK